MPEEVMKYIIKEGGKAYYDDIPRYKNPYSGISGDFWFEGWDQANSVHELFTKNQTLEAQNKQLSDDNKYLVSKFSQKEEDIDVILDTLLKHLKTGMFIFSRGNIETGIFQIKDILNKV